VSTAAQPAAAVLTSPESLTRGQRYVVLTAAFLAPRPPGRAPSALQAAGVPTVALAAVASGSGTPDPAFQTMVLQGFDDTVPSRSSR